MSLVDRIDALKEKHHGLESAIDSASSRPHPDDDEITALKKQKLAIKDEISQLNVS